MELTDDEWKIYQEICRSYDRPNFKGEDLFRELFETNGDGIITFVRPPTRNFSSMEVFLFLISIMTNQHLRLCHEQVEALCRESKDNINIMLQEIKDTLAEFNKLKS